MKTKDVTNYLFPKEKRKESAVNNYENLRNLIKTKANKEKQQ